MTSHQHRVKELRTGVLQRVQAAVLHDNELYRPGTICLDTFTCDGRHQLIPRSN